MNRTKIGIVGLHWGASILNDLAAHDGYGCIEVAAVCDLDFERTTIIAAQHNVKPCRSIDEMLEDSGIEAIGLFTPPYGRAELIGRIVAAGRHVMTTKPFELDADKACDVLRKAKELGKVVHLNSPSPLPSADLALIEKWIFKYGLGRPVACRCDTWTYYRESPDGKWYDDPGLCPVAPVFRLGIYLVNDLVRLFGRAECVQVMHSRLFTGRPTPDNAQLGIRFRNGAICNVFASFCVRDGQAYKNSLVLNFENGTVYRNIGPLSQDETHSASHMTLMARGGREEPFVETAIVEGCSGLYQWKEFHSAVTGRPPEGEVTVEEIAEGIRIMNAAARAEITGKTETV